jgi:hypothetical protein
MGHQITEKTKIKDLKNQIDSIEDFITNNLTGDEFSFTDKENEVLDEVDDLIIKIQKQLGEII